MKRGRTSAAELSVIQLHPSLDRVETPSDLSREEQALFRQIVVNCARDHFLPHDVPLLVRYVEASVKARRLSKDPSDQKAWEQAAKIQTTLATRLRITPHSRTDPKVVARKYRDHCPSAYEQMGDDE